MEGPREPLKQVSCDDAACGFRIMSRSDDELVSMLQRHAKDVHGLDASPEEITVKIQTVEGESA